MTTRDDQGLTPDELKAIEALQEPLKGLPESERKQLIDKILESHTPQEILANPDFIAFEAYDNPTLDAGRAVNAVEPPADLPKTVDSRSRRVGENSWTDEELAELVAYGGEESLTPEQKAAYDEIVAEDGEAKSNLEAMIAVINAQTAAPDWTLEFLTRPLTDEDITAIGSLMIEFDPSLAPTLMAKLDAQPNEDDNMTLRRNTLMLLNAGNEFALSSLMEYAAEEEIRSVDVKIDGNKYQDVRQFADQFADGRLSRAGLAYKAAVDAGVDTNLYGRVWERNRKDKTWQDDIEEGSGGQRRRVNRDSVQLGGDAGLARKLREGIDVYGDSIAAVLHVEDPDLANKLVNDPWGLTVEELTHVQDIVGQAREGDSYATQLQSNWLTERLAGGFGGQEITVDTQASIEAARTLANNWNLPGLPDGVLAGIGAGWYGEAKARVTSSLPNPFQPELADPGGTARVGALDVDTFVKQHIRALPEYQALFGKMVAGENEEDWVARFEGQSQGLLGDVDLEAVRAGMRSGDRDTVGQQALISGTASNSSRFRERLANMGNAFKEVT